MNKIINHFIFKYCFKDEENTPRKAININICSGILAIILTALMSAISWNYIDSNAEETTGVIFNLISSCSFLFFITALSSVTVFTFISIYEKIIKLKKIEKYIKNKSLEIEINEFENVFYKYEIMYLDPDFNKDCNIFDILLSEEDFIELYNFLKKEDVNIKNFKQLLKGILNNKETVDIKFKDVFYILKLIEPDIKKEKQKQKIDEILESVFKE